MSQSYLIIAVIIAICFVWANSEAAEKKEVKRAMLWNPPRPAGPPPKVDGRWSPWSQWNTCSKTCDGGVQFRRRTCNSPSQSGGGKRCRPPSFAIRRCPCSRVNGGWSAYGAWGACTVTCGGGIRTRTRTCTKPRPSCCGDSCNGPSSETGTCNQQSCDPIAAMAKRFAQAVMFNTATSRTKICRARPPICSNALTMPHSHRRAKRDCTPRTPICKHVCNYHERDFLFILDASGSIGEDNFEMAKFDLMIIAANLCGNLGRDLQEAAMVFSRTSKIVFPFDEFGPYEMIDLTMSIPLIPYLRSTTWTWRAFDFARETMFTPASGNRPGVTKQALIITDGESYGVSDARRLSIAAAQALKDSGVEVFALWIGDPSAADLDEIREYVSEDKDEHVFSVDSVASLHDLSLNLLLLKKNTCCT